MFRREQPTLPELGDVEHISIVISGVFWSLICAIPLSSHVYVHVYFNMYMNVNITFTQDLKTGVHVYTVSWSAAIYLFLVPTSINDNIIL